MADGHGGDQMSEMSWKPRVEEFQEGRNRVTFKKDLNFLQTLRCFIHKVRYSYKVPLSK